jgi:hypothetical protein
MYFWMIMEKRIDTIDVVGVADYVLWDAARWVRR